MQDESHAGAIVADAAWEDMPRPDIVVLPGGYGSRAMMRDDRALAWLSEAHEHQLATRHPCAPARCGWPLPGSWRPPEATSHWLELETAGRVRRPLPTPRRVVEQGKVITAAGVSSGIDMALRLTELLYGHRGRAGGPAGDRIRPPAAVRRRVAAQGAGADPWRLVRTVMSAQQEELGA